MEVSRLSSPPTSLLVSRACPAWSHPAGCCNDLFVQLRVGVRSYGLRSLRRLGSCSIPQPFGGSLVPRQGFPVHVLPSVVCHLLLHGGCRRGPDSKERAGLEGVGPDPPPDRQGIFTSREGGSSSIAGSEVAAVAPAPSGVPTLYPHTLTHHQRASGSIPPPRRLEWQATSSSST